MGAPFNETFYPKQAFNFNVKAVEEPLAYATKLSIAGKAYTNGWSDCKDPLNPKANHAKAVMILESINWNGEATDAVSISARVTGDTAIALETDLAGKSDATVTFQIDAYKFDIRDAKGGGQIWFKCFTTKAEDKTTNMVSSGGKLDYNVNMQGEGNPKTYRFSFTLAPPEATNMPLHHGAADGFVRPWDWGRTKG